METMINIPSIASQRALAALLCATPAQPTTPVAGISVRGTWTGGFAGTDVQRMRATTAKRHAVFADIPGSQSWSPPI